MRQLTNLPRNVFVRVLVRLFSRSRGAAPPMQWRGRPFRVLFIRNDAIGDVIVSMEVMRAIAEASPDIVLDVLGTAQNQTILRTLPFVHDVLLHERRFLPRAWPLWKKLRARRYDAVIDGRVHPPGVSVHTACILLSTGAPWRIGIGGRHNDDVYTVKIDVPYMPHWTDYLVALAKPFGIDADGRDWRPRLPVAPEDRAHVEREWERGGPGRPRVLVNVSVRDPRRSWPADKFAVLLGRLRQRLPGANIMLATVPSEQAAADALVTPVGGRAVPLTLPQVFAAIATADLLISPETAITHAASAFRTPTLALQKKDNERWSPYRTPGRNVAADDARVSSIPTQRAIDALESLIDEMGPARGWQVAVVPPRSGG